MGILEHSKKEGNFKFYIILRASSMDSNKHKFWIIQEIQKETYNLL